MGNCAIGAGIQAGDMEGAKNCSGGLYRTCTVGDGSMGSSPTDQSVCSPHIDDSATERTPEPLLYRQ